MYVVINCIYVNITQKERLSVMLKSNLDFICDFFQRCHIRTSIVSLSESIDSVLDAHFFDIAGLFFDKRFSVNTYFGDIEPMTQYRFTDDFQFCYIYLQLPFDEPKNILFIGPFLSTSYSTIDIYELGERIGISPHAKEPFEEYYRSIPVLSPGDRLFTMIDTFCERIWDSPTFSITEVNKPLSSLFTTLDTLSQTNTFDETLANINVLEIRYSFENELTRAIVNGQLQKENLLLDAIKENAFQKRLTDPVRNAKNYCIIMNTLSRKAAEQGGVHPFYIDRTSSDFAARIEQLGAISEAPILIREMFRTYCQLVRTHMTKPYSPIIQTTMMIIDSNLSAELSLHPLAAQQGISDGYLSMIFKKETGKTVSEYIREKRIQHAMHLLNTTHLQIQTIALHCGIMDVQYFSKIFKKQTGKTPLEYRKSLRLK